MQNMLESNRVYARNQNESNFHVLYAMKSTSGDLCKELNLNIAEYYAASRLISLV